MTFLAWFWSSFMFMVLAISAIDSSESFVMRSICSGLRKESMM